MRFSQCLHSTSLLLAALAPLALGAGCGGGGGTGLSPTPELGAIVGTVWLDADGDGTFGTEVEEPGLAGFIVYADLNGNGVFDPSEPFAISEGAGFFQLVLPAGTYTIGIVPLSGFRVTSPGRGNLRQPTLIPQSRIVGGTDAPAGQFPWMTAIVPRTKDNAFEGFTCGGTLIQPTWVLSAAHCFFDPGNNLNRDPDDFYDVVIGRDVLTKEGTGERIPVRRFIIFPEYPPRQAELKALVGDIALLELERPSSQPFVPIAKPEDDALLTDGTFSTLLGWGGLLPRGGQLNVDPPEPPQEFSDRLQLAQVPIVSNPICNQGAFPQAGSIIDSMLCAGFAEGGIDSCQGDSGGPLLINSGRGLIQVGVVSIGFGCAQPQSFGIYTRVSSFADWVDAIVTSPIANGYRVQLRAGQVFDKADFGFQRVF